MSDIHFPSPALGLGHKVHTVVTKPDGTPEAYGYAIGTNVITWLGGQLNGLKEVVDATGIAAGYRVIKQIKHADVNVRITWNGTNSKVYRQEAGVWALKETVNSARCWDTVTFTDSAGNNIWAVSYGADAAFRYSTDNGTTWTASTFTGTAGKVKYFLPQENNVAAPRVLWCVDPNELYFATSLINGTTVSTSSLVGHASSQEYWTSLAQEPAGTVYCGKRHTLYSFANGPAVIVLGPFPDPPADAGGQSDRMNFENPQVTDDGWLLYVAEGYRLFGVRPGEVRPALEPRQAARERGWNLPRTDLPINAVQTIGEFVVVALGDGQSATTRSAVSLPGGSQLAQNTFVITSELYVGVRNGDELTWHGSALTCTSLLRGFAYDEDDGYLYLFSGASESADLQARRCYFLRTAPDVLLVSSNLQLNASVGIVETAVIGAEDVFDAQTWEWFGALATGLASTVPSLRVDYRLAPEHDTTSGFTTLETYTDGQRALNGTELPRWSSGTVGRLQFRLTGDSVSSPNRFAVLRNAKLRVGVHAKRRVPMGVL